MLLSAYVLHVLLVCTVLSVMHVLHVNTFLCLKLPPLSVTRAAVLLRFAIVLLYEVCMSVVVFFNYLVNKGVRCGVLLVGNLL